MFSDSGSLTGMMSGPIVQSQNLMSQHSFGQLSSMARSTAAVFGQTHNSQMLTSFSSRDKLGAPASYNTTSTKADKSAELLKTPVSLLNEVCAKAKITPQFETTEDGPPHERVFECTVKLEKQGMIWEGKGSARAKKDAKQEAAKTLLLSMDQQVEKLLVPVKSTQEMTPTLECDPEVEGNPIGELNDLCLKIKRMPPDYEDSGEEGKPHERVYTVTCKLGNQIEEQGRGRTKRTAKKVAAYKVKQRLSELMVNADALQVPKEEEDSIVDKIQAINLGKKSKAPKDSIKLEDWFEEFKSRCGEKLGSIQDILKVSNICPTKLLRDIAEEQKFKVQYMDLQNSEKSGDSEEFCAVVSLGLEPMAIFLGKGGSKTQGRKSAAANAIEFLRLSTRK